VKKVILHVEKDGTMAYVCPPTHHFNNWKQLAGASEHGIPVGWSEIAVVKQMVADDTFPAWEELDNTRLQPMAKTVVDFLVGMHANDEIATAEAAVEFLRVQRSGGEEEKRVEAWKKHISWLS